MSLAAAIQKHAGSQTLEQIIASLDTKDREDLFTALLDSNIGHVAIARGLKEHTGTAISEAAIRRWRDRNANQSEEVFGL